MCLLVYIYIYVCVCVCVCVILLGIFDCPFSNTNAII